MLRIAPNGAMTAKRYVVPVGIGQMVGPRGLGQGQPKQLDPLVEVALNTAVQLLKDRDPQVATTAQLIRRVVVAPGFGIQRDTATGTRAKLSSINDTLAIIANFREHSWGYTALALGLPVLAFFLGRAVGSRAKR